MSGKWRIAVLGLRVDSLDVEEEVLRGHDVEWQCHLGGTEEEVLAHGRDADVILAGSICRLGRPVIEGLRRCRAIVRYGIGVDNVDVAAASARGIWVANVPDYCTEEVATHTLLLLLACNRKLLAAADQVRSARGWGIAPLKPIHDLGSQTLGLIGFGKIGRAVAAKAAALGLKILVSDPYVSAADIRRAGAEPAALPDLLARSDYVSLHLPLTDGTRRLIDREGLRLMKPTAYLINTARGGLIEEAALLEALDEGRLAGAALDVLEVEPPPPGHPLIGHPRVLLTPHAAWYSERAAREMRERAAREALRVLEGHPPANAVNRF